MKYLFLILILSCSLNFAQENFPKIEQSDFDGIKLTRGDYYNGTSLWGYIDGGADLYLEYGFSKIAVQEIEFKSHKYKVDIYKMNDAGAAFGIFSISQYKCSDKSICKYSCVTEYQVQAAKGSYFISITNEKGTSEEQEFCIKLADKIISKINENDYILPPCFNITIFKLSQVKFVNGILGVQNAFADWEEFFKNYEKFSFHVVDLEDNGKFFYLFRIEFNKKYDLDSLRHYSENIVKASAGTASVNFMKISETEVDMMYSDMPEDKKENIIKICFKE